MQSIKSNIITEIESPANTLHHKDGIYSGKKLGFVISSLSSGGAERVVSTLANKLVEKYQVYIFTHAESDPFYPLDTRVIVQNCGHKTQVSGLFNRLFNILGLYGKIKKVVKSNDIDVCISFMTTSNVLTALACKKLDVPVIISERNNPYQEDKNLSWFWKVLRRFSYPKASTLVVQTKQVRKYYEPFIDQNKLSVIANPINPDFEKTKLTGYRENTILNVGRLSSQKNQDLLIRAFSNVKNHGWQLKIFGEGSKRDELQELINSLQLGDKIKLLGRCKNLTDQYSTAKIFVLSSRFEGFPNALMEAMYMGMACVSTNCPSGPSDLINHNNNGVLIPVDGQKDLEEALVDLMNNEDKLRELGSAAKKSMAAYGSDEISSKWNSLIHEAIVLSGKHKTS